MSTHTERVQFTFGDRVLEGVVVRREFEAQFNDRQRTRLHVDVDGHEFAVLERDAWDATPARADA